MVVGANQGMLEGVHIVCRPVGSNFVVIHPLPKTVHRGALVSFPDPTNSAPAWIAFSIACGEEGLLTFVMFPCSLKKFVLSQ